MKKILFLFTFSGRMNRAKFTIYQIILTLIVFLIYPLETTSNASFLLLGCLATIILAISSISSIVRRLHDVNLPAWFILIMLIPAMGQAFGIVLFFKKPYYGVNKYGANPACKSNESHGLVVE